MEATADFVIVQDADLEYDPVDYELMMEPLLEDLANPEIATDYKEVEDGYREIVDKHYPDTPPIAMVGKYDFYEQTQKAFAVVMTGDTRIYANLILKKGVTTW